MGSVAMARRGRKRNLERERLYWDLLASGLGTVQACRQVGIGRRTGLRWRRENGGFRRDLAGEAHHQRLRGSSSPAKKTVAAFKIALSSSIRPTAALSALISASSALVGPCRCPESTWACSTHRRTLSPPTPSFLATAADAAVNDAYSCWCSVTIRTARTFSSGSIFFGMTSSSWTQTGAASNLGRFRLFPTGIGLPRT